MCVCVWIQGYNIGLRKKKKWNIRKYKRERKNRKKKERGKKKKKKGERQRERERDHLDDVTAAVDSPFWPASTAGGCHLCSGPPDFTWETAAIYALVSTTRVES